MSIRGSIVRHLRLDLVSRSLLTVLLVLSLGFNVVMALRVRSVMARLSPPASVLNIGDVAPSIPLLDLEGRQMRLAFDTKNPTILYYFSPDCPWSRRNSQNIAALAADTVERYRFISYSRGPIARNDAKRANGAPMPILTDGTDGPLSLRLQYKLVGTPETLVISSDGHVMRNWQGAYRGELKSEIERFFGVQLPGLSP